MEVSASTKDSNVITSDCFSITFTDENDISLEQAYPLNKEEMISYLKTATPYHFTITNKCDSVARGYMNLETMPVEEKRLSDQYINALLYDGNTNLSDAIYFNTYDYVLPSYIVLYPTKDSPDDFISHYSFLLNNADINEEKVISNSLTAYKLSDILLRAGESLEFNLLLWMDESTPVSALLLKENTWKDMLLFILFSTLAMYSHNYSIFAIFIFLIIEFITSLFLKKARLKTLLSLILTILLFIPWLNVLLNQAQALNENFWISSPNLAVLFHCLYFIFGSHKYLVLIIIDILLIFLFWGIYKKPRTVIQALYIFLPSFLSLLFFILWSIYKTPMFIPRYMVPVLGGIILFLACICSIPKKNYLLIILILILVFPFFNNYKEEILKTDDTPTKEMIKYIENNSEEEKNFLHIGEFSLGEMEYYFPNSNHFYYESVPIYVTVPEIYGKTHMLSLKEKLPKEKYILVSQVPFSDFEKRFNLTVVNQQTFIIPYQGKRYVYILNPINE